MRRGPPAPVQKMFFATLSLCPVEEVLKLNHIDMPLSCTWYMAYQTRQKVQKVRSKLSTMFLPEGIKTQKCMEGKNCHQQKWMSVSAKNGSYLTIDFKYFQSTIISLKFCLLFSKSCQDLLVYVSAYFSSLFFTLIYTSAEY